MRCPFCGHTEDRVVDSRVGRDGEFIRRRRECLKCHRRYTTYEYIDVFFTTAAMGSVSVTDANSLRPAGSSWTVPGSVTANVVPAAGRVLYGNVEVRTDQNVLVGRGDVVVENVTP